MRLNFNGEVPTKETCIKLKKLGYAGPSLVMMQVQILADKSERVEYVDPVDAFYRAGDKQYSKKEYAWYPAPLASELLVHFPTGMQFDISICPAGEGKHSLWYWSDRAVRDSNNLAESFAQVLIFLVQEKRISFNGADKSQLYEAR